MKSSFDESSIFSRAKNFRWDTTSLAKRYSEDSNSVLDYEILRDVVIQFCDSGILADSSHPERLEQVFCKIYTILKKEEVICWLFDQHPTFSAHVYEACLFTSLASFLNTSKRIRGMSLTDFVKQNDPIISLKQDLSNYPVLNLVEPEVEKFRKARMRRLAAGDVYIKDTQWSAMTKDSVYEWAVFFALETAEPTIRDTHKRLGNLYKGIQPAIASEQDDGYNDRVQVKYEQFLSKLRKIKYENYLELNKMILERICKNKEYYGLNLYRLEKRLQPYKIIREVKRLTECQLPEEEAELLYRMVCLDDICFPKIYEDLLFSPLECVQKYGNAFQEFLKTSTVISCLILDELVESGFFGDNWESLFLDTINNMAEEVLYDPQKIDFTETDNAQEKFVRDLHAGIFIEIHAACNSKFCLTDLLI